MDGYRYFLPLFAVIKNDGSALSIYVNIGLRLTASAYCQVNRRRRLTGNSEYQLSFLGVKSLGISSSAELLLG